MVDLETYDVVEPERPRLKQSFSENIKGKYSEFREEKQRLKEVENQEFQRQKHQVAAERYEKKVEKAREKAYNRTHRKEQFQRVVGATARGIGGFLQNVGKNIQAREQRERPRSQPVQRYSQPRAIRSQPKPLFNPPKFNLGKGMSLGVKPLKFKTKRFKL